MRLTRKENEAYVLTENTDAEAVIEELGKLEDMYDRLLAEYENTKAQLQTLKEQGKTKSVTYHQQFANKLKLKELIGRFEIALG
jgi:cell fate (sporulation/competence/biofilm development) regulator YlbF (YheA/YmcA/DUF963 family)